MMKKKYITPDCVYATMRTADVISASTGMSVGNFFVGDTAPEIGNEFDVILFD